MSFDHTILKGTTSKIIEIMLRDSTTGQGKTGLTTGSMSGAYVREGSTHVSLSFSAGSAGDSFSAGKWAEVDATNMAGVYQYHLPDLSLASGVDAVTFRFSASGVIDKVVRISLLDVDLRDSVNAGLSGLTVIDNVVDDILVDTGTTLPALISSSSPLTASEIRAAVGLASANLDTQLDTIDTNVDAILVDTSTTIPALFPTNSSLLVIDGSGRVTVGSNADKSGYSISGTKTTLDALNDIAATSIVSGGAITTAGGAVSSVTTVSVCSTNSDMRGTDSALLASSAPTNFNLLSVDGSGRVVVGTNNDKTNYSISGSKNTLDDLNDLTAAQVNSQVDVALSDIGLDHLVSVAVSGTDVANNSVIAKMVSKSATADWDSFDSTSDSLEAIRDRGDSSWTPSGGLTASEIADAVLDEALSGHTTAGTLGKAISDIESDADMILTDTGTTLPATLVSLDGKVTTVDGVVDAIANDTSTIITNLATVDGKVDTVDGIVDAILVDTGTTLPATLAGLSTLDAAGVRSAVGLATNNLDTQLADIPTVAEFEARTVVSGAYFDPAVDKVTVSVNEDKADYALSSASREQIGDDFLAHVITKGSPQTIERAFWQALKAQTSLDGEVTGTPTVSAFDTNLTVTSGAIDHLLLLMVSGSLEGEARPIDSYSSTNGRIVLQESLTGVPASGDEFIVVPSHSHPISEITDGVWNASSASYTTDGTFGYLVDAQISTVGGDDAATVADQVWNELRAGHTTVGSFGYYLDARVSQVSGGGGASASDIWGALLSDHQVAGTFGARFQEARRYTNTDAEIRYVVQGDAYDDVANDAIEWAVTTDYSGASSLTLKVYHRVTDELLLSHAVTYVDATTLKAYLSGDDTAFASLTTTADFGVHPYRVVAEVGGETDTVVIGVMSITRAS